jgi:hypothetical protein
MNYKIAGNLSRFIFRGKRRVSQQMGQHHNGDERRESAEDKAVRMVAVGLSEAA